MAPRERAATKTSLAVGQSGSERSQKVTESGAERVRAGAKKITESGAERVRAEEIRAKWGRAGQSGGHRGRAGQSEKQGGAERGRAVGQSGSEQVGQSGAERWGRAGQSGRKKCKKR